MKKTVVCLFLAVFAGAGQYALAGEPTAGTPAAGEPALCLDCHEPAADWQGMSVEEILETARDPDIKRHKDNLELSDEQVRAMVELLMK